MWFLISSFFVVANVIWAAEPAAAPDPYSLFEKPGKMVRLSKGNALSMYCSGAGFLTIILEAGFRGGAYASWYKLQPLLSLRHRTCSYDRAGYGFSELGSDLPRDLNHAVRDLHEMLRKSGEKAPYILVGHSNGGLIVGAFADLYPEEVAGLVFLDAAIALKRYPISPAVGAGAVHPNKYLEADLQHVKECGQFAAEHNLAKLAGPQSTCINTEDFSGLPSAMAQVEISNEEKPSFWAALLSESESNYRDQISSQAMALLPHHWSKIPIRVVTAAIPPVDDMKAAELFGIPANDKAALDSARTNRQRWEGRQAEACHYASNCKVRKVPTFMHLVQNADPALVAQTIEEIGNGSVAALHSDPRRGRDARSAFD